MEDFHEDIQSKILSHIPDQSVLNCKLVCKRWQQLLSKRKVSLGILFSITRSSEIQLYYADYDVIKNTKHGKEFYKKRITKLNVPPIEEIGRNKQVIVGSCNGLVCMALPHHGVNDPVYICNPFTSEYKFLPLISSNLWDVTSGFGYLPSTNEYKVVRILYRTDRYYCSSSTTKGQVQVYTLGSHNGWRNITETKYSLPHREAGILANESLYWKDKNHNKIVAFDLKDEIFRELPAPLCIQLPRVYFSITNKKTYPIFWLIMLGGYLCLVDHSSAYDRLDIWLFTKDIKSSYDVTEQDYYHDWSWSKKFSIEWQGDSNLYEPFAFRKNEILIWSGWDGTTLKSYNPETNSLNVMLDREDSFYPTTFKGVLHMHTLVSLKDLGEESETWVQPAFENSQRISRKRKRLRPCLFSADSSDFSDSSGSDFSDSSGSD